MRAPAITYGFPFSRAGRCFSGIPAARISCFCWTVKWTGFLFSLLLRGRPPFVLDLLVGLLFFIFVFVFFNVNNVIRDTHYQRIVILIIEKDIKKSREYVIGCSVHCCSNQNFTKNKGLILCNRTLFLKKYLYNSQIFIINNIMIINIFLIYQLIINIATFIIRWIDKRKSINHKRRISEKELLIFSALWWFVWAILWMSIWHHKTIKSKFLRKFWLIVFIWIVILIVVYYFLNR